jgi:hypothetical protein
MFLFLLFGRTASGFLHDPLSFPRRLSYTKERGRSYDRLMTSENQHEAISKSKNSVTSFVVAASLAVSAALDLPLPVMAYSLGDNFDAQGISSVTQSKLGQSVRGAVIGGAQIADSLDMKWERFSDGLRDKQKCDPRTNRRMFDNGTRRDGTKIGSPVLGALCTPEPLRAFDSEFANMVTKLAEDAMVDDMDMPGGMDRSKLKQIEKQIKEKVGPAFARAAASTGSSNNENDETLQAQKRQAFNQDLYIQMRAYGQSIPPKQENYRTLEKSWGKKLLTTVAPNANRNDYTSPFPKPDQTDDQPYDEASLLDALGAISVTLNKFQDAGLIGHWEISIPEDDFWSVVTIAVDDDITIGGQILARASKLPLNGSAVVAVIRSAMEDKARIPYKMDTFFIDPTTTRQELYNPTQLLVSLSDLGL